MEPRDQRHRRVRAGLALAASVAARMEPGGREQHGWANREVEWAGAHESKRGQRASFNPLAMTAAGEYYRIATRNSHLSSC
jgi:hypothetical protein